MWGDNVLVGLDLLLLRCLTTYDELLVSVLNAILRRSVLLLFLIIVRILAYVELLLILLVYSLKLVRHDG